MYVLHYTHLVRIVEFICKHYDEATDLINTFVQSLHVQSYNLPPVIPAPISLDTIEVRVIRNGEIETIRTIDISDMPESDRVNLIADKLKDYSTAKEAMTIHRKDFMMYLKSEHIKTEGYKRYIWATMMKVAGPLKVLW